MKTIQVRRTTHVGHSWRSKDELISDILQWTPSHGWAKAGWPARTYIQQLCADTGCSLEDLPGAKDDRNGWWERVREICAGSATWWWWWWFLLLSDRSLHHTILCILRDYKNELKSQPKALLILHCLKQFQLSSILYYSYAYSEPPQKKISFLLLY